MGTTSKPMIKYDQYPELTDAQLLQQQQLGGSLAGAIGSGISPYMTGTYTIPQWGTSVTTGSSWTFNYPPPLDVDQTFICGVEFSKDEVKILKKLVSKIKDSVDLGNEVGLEQAIEDAVAALKG